MKLFSLLVLSALFAAMLVGGCTGSKAPPSQEAAQNASLKVIGLVGGVSWHSSSEYYKIMNKQVNRQLGDPHSAKVLMYSIDFNDVSDQVKRAQPEDLAQVRGKMVDAAKRLEAGGADFVVVGSNTMNLFVPDIRSSIGIPVIDISDATGKAVKKSGLRKVILLGSKIVTEHDFYKDNLEKNYGVEVILPNATERDYINSVIFDELCVGKFSNQSRDNIVGIISRLEKEQGAEGVILGCTELPLLIKQKDVNIPVFDTTEIHATAAVDYAMGRG